MRNCPRLRSIYQAINGRDIEIMLHDATILPRVTVGVHHGSYITGFYVDHKRPYNLLHLLLLQKVFLLIFELLGNDTGMRRNVSLEEKKTCNIHELFGNMTHS